MLLGVSLGSTTTLSMRYYMRRFLVSTAVTIVVTSALQGLPIWGYAQDVGSVGSQRHPCPKSVSLEEFRALAFEKSPIVAQIDAEYAQQVAHAFETEVLVNPELQAEQVYTRMKLGGADDPQTNASLGIPLRLSDFGARGRVAALIKKTGDAQKRAAILELSQRVALHFHSLAAIQSSIQILSDTQERAARHVSRMDDAVAKGLVSQAEQKLFDGERYRLQALKKGLQSSFANLRAEVTRSLGIQCLFGIKEGKRHLVELPSEEMLVSKAGQSEISELSRLDLSYALSREQVRLSKLDAIPEFSPRLVYQHTNDGGDFIGVGVAVPLPLFNRNQGAVARTAADSALALRKKDFLADGGLRDQVAMLRSSALSLAEQSQLYETKVVPSFRAALESYEKLYAQGKGSVSQTWQALRTYSDAQREALSVWLQALGARMQLSLLIGEEL